MEIIMKKNIFKSVLTVLLAVSLLVIPVSAFELPGEIQYRYISEMADYIQNNYKFDITREALLDAALHERLVNPECEFNDMIAAMLDILDENSSYLTQEEYQTMMEHSVTGTFSGIGVTITSKNERVIVVSPIIGSPAHAAGMLPNDVIITVNGEDVSRSTMDYVRSLIVGPKGTSVSVGVLRGDKILIFDIIRDEVKNVPVTYEIKDGIGYIRITAFNQNIVEAVQEALAEFDSQGIDKIAIDLRYNPGGELNEAVSLCRLFVPKGVVVRIKYKDSEKDEIYYSELDAPRYKLAVLINEGSASASELFAGAVQDTAVAKVFGTTSYGKGTVQQLMPIVTGGCIRLTVAEYLTAGGRSINKKGITPDVYVENTKRVPDTSGFSDIDFSSVLTAGADSDGVLALEQRLVVLGFLETADSVYDAETEDAVKTFQAYRGLSATGTADTYTLLEINNIDYDVPFPVDNQYIAAMEYLKGL